MQPPFSTPYIANNPQKDHDITLYFHDIRGRRTRSFALRVLKIVLDEKKPFSKEDFPDMRGDTYRQYIKKLKPYLELVIDSRPRFWKIKGVQLPGYSRKCTFRDMGVGEQFERLLESITHNHPKFHDIKFKVLHDGELYQNLVNKGCPTNKSNGGIRYNFPSIQQSLDTKCVIYKHIIQIDIGCTFEPLIYDHTSLFELLEHLSKLSSSLCGLAGCYSLPSVHEWILTHYHLNVDSSIEYSGKTFEFKVNDFATGLIRFYSKKFQNGKTFARIEQVETPGKTLGETLKEACSSMKE